LTGGGASRIVRVHMAAKSLLMLLFVGVWILSGSLALAVDLCPTMGAMCEAPCGLGVLAVEATPTSFTPLSPTALECPLQLGLAATAPRAIDPVPKSIRLSA